MDKWTKNNCIKGWKGLSYFLNQKLFPWAGGSWKQPLKYSALLFEKKIFGIRRKNSLIIIPPKNLEFLILYYKTISNCFSKILPIIITFTASAITHQNCCSSFFTVYHLKLLHCCCCGSLLLIRFNSKLKSSWSFFYYWECNFKHSFYF